MLMQTWPDAEVTGLGIKRLKVQILIQEATPHCPSPPTHSAGMMVTMSSSLEDTRKENKPEVPQGRLCYNVCTVQNP